MEPAVVKVVTIPENVSVEIAGAVVTVKGPKGTLEKDFFNPRFSETVRIEKNGGVKITSASERRTHKAIAGTIQSHVENMITGVSVGYKYVMKITYSHFPLTVTVKDKEVQIKNFLGEKGLRIARIIGDCSVKTDKEEITITDISKDDVGQTASNIEQACRITGRDRRIFQDGIFIAGKYLQNGEEL
ncbi:MAG: 50S ribosomal protein L6 [Candidatus Aenigmarchaeota archaeon]|nr:50S ribosomal protein L6 [Candidatus Aenigmarchaeota archaeon]